MHGLVTVANNTALDTGNTLKAWILDIFITKANSNYVRLHGTYFDCSNPFTQYMYSILCYTLFLTKTIYFKRLLKDLTVGLCFSSHLWILCELKIFFIKTVFENSE